MIYNASLWLFYHAPSGAVLVRKATFLTYCPLTGTHMPLNSTWRALPRFIPPPKEKSKEEKNIKVPWHSFKILLAQAFSPRGTIEQLINVSSRRFLLGKNASYDKINDHLKNKQQNTTTQFQLHPWIQANKSEQSMWITKGSTPKPRLFTYIPPKKWQAMRSKCQLTWWKERQRDCFPFLFMWKYIFIFQVQKFLLRRLAP